MAGNLPVPQGLEAKFVWARAGVPFALNILHFQHAVGTLHTQARADTFSNTVQTQLTGSGLLGQLHTSISLLRVETRHMDSNSDPWFIGAGTGGSGTGVGDLLPLANCLVVSLKTGLRGRSYNGRYYQAGWSEGANDANGQCLQAAAINASDFVGDLIAAMQTALSLQFSILSRWVTPPTAPPNTPATERNPPILTPVIAAPVLDLRWDVQRRRSNPGI